MKYIYITLDAVDILTTIRQYQSIDYQLGYNLYMTISGSITNLQDDIRISKFENGIVLSTEKINKNAGVLFDLTTFHAFAEKDPKSVITVLQKILKFAVKYYNHLAYAPCERDINTKTSIVFPFPFIATKNAYKVLIDKNSSRYNRKGKDILTVYYSGEETYEKDVSFTSLKKAMDDIMGLTFDRISVTDSVSQIDTFQTTNLGDFDLSLDSNIGYEMWGQYLTSRQKNFIYKDINGTERLEGAAGTGKTLSMVLRCIYLLKNNKNRRYVFVTHSKATKEHIIHIFRNNYRDVDDLLCLNDEDISKPLLVTTLQEWCIHFLGVYLSETEYLDKDAQNSKELQLLYIDEAYSKFKETSWSSYAPLCSKEFSQYLERTDPSLLLEMLQYEIATLIKGRAESDLDKYKVLSRPKYAIPCESETDRIVLYLIFKQYQSDLEKINQFDSDDIILTALGQLNTPIWKRRRNLEGFDACFIDETHLFNLNELSIFHYLNKDDSKNNIVFAIDKSQYIGERGILDDTMYSILNTSDKNRYSENYDIVFRCSPEIVNLAYMVLSSGASVFDHFENPLIDSTAIMSKNEILKCKNPRYELLVSDDEMIERAFREVDEYSRDNKVPKSNILIAVTTADLLIKAKKYAERMRKKYSVIKSRGDSKAVRSAFISQQYVIGGIDYIGGLEFDYVIIIGVDDGRVPPKNTKESLHFIKYAWYNRMYVAISRAKYAILLLGNKSESPSQILDSAISSGAIETNIAE